MNNLFKKSLSVILSIMLVVSGFSLPATAFASSAEKNTSSKTNFVEGEAIAVFKNGTSNKLFSQKNTASVFGEGITLKASYSFGGNESAVKKYSAKNGGSYSSSELKIATFTSESMSTKQLITKLEKNENIKFAIPNFKKKIASVTNDTYSDYQWALDNIGQNGGTSGMDINAQNVWSKAETSTKEPVVAVLDTGIDYNHEDLKDSLWVNPYGAKLVGKYGYDFTYTNKDGSPLDDNGHGTHVAGIIAAKGDDGKGISGINKNGVKIMSLKWLDADGYGETDDVIAAYDYVSRAMSLGTNVVAVNNSWGGQGTEEEIALFDMIFDEVGKMGAVSFIAAGNDSLDFSEPVQEEFPFLLVDEEENVYNVPAACESDYAITVAATNEKDELADFSSYSKKYVDVSAPGVDILSTVSYNCFNPSIYSSEQRNTLCSSYQSFDNSLSDSDFGKPVAVPNYKFNGENFTTSSSIYTSDDYFGVNGKSISLKTNDVIEKNESKFYIYSIPYSIADKDKNYSYSFMMKANNEAEVMVFDLPQSFNVSDFDKFDDVQADLGLLYGKTDNFWEHMSYNRDVTSDSEFVYEKDTQRQIVLIVNAYEKDTVVTIDDLAISNQSANEDDFGKFDFYNGTSMATPYAVGAYALLSRAYPNASTLDLINMLKNTGRISNALEGKTQNNRILSLENPENTPPMITSFAYDSKGNITVNGSFKDTKEVKVNSVKVNPVSMSSNKIVIPDNKYSTKKITIEVSNDFGSDSLSALVSNKKAYTAAKDVLAPAVFEENTFALPAGDTAYFFDSIGTVCSVYYDDFEEKYVYDDLGATVDISKIFKNAFIGEPQFTAAAYMGGKIYFTAELPIRATNEVVIGYDKAFCSIDINTEKTTKLCELPNDMMEGFTLAGYNGAVYLIGGYDNSTSSYSKAVYKYDASKKNFSKVSVQLPEGRAFGKTVQYKNKLIYTYGANEKGTMPNMLVYDGKAWSESKIALSSEDCEKYLLQNNESANVYDGNVGIASTGVFCSGAYVYGRGDTFTYNVDKDTITSSAYSIYNTLNGEGSIIGTTLPDCFIGFSVSDESETFGDVLTAGAIAYKIPVKTGFATVEPDYLAEHCMIDTGESINCVYGDSISVTVYPDSGYIVTGILANKAKYTPSKNKANIIIKDANTVVSATLKKVAPNQVKSLKVASTTSTSYTLSWSKPSRAAGYQIQQYKNKKWQTIATIKSADKTTYKVSKQTSGSNKYRVRAYSVYNSKKYYGSYSKTIDVFVPSKQTVKSLTAGAKSFTVKYKKNNAASGFQIQYATNSKFKSAVIKTVKSNKKLSYKATKLSSKKKYYVRVRSYKIINGKKVYGAWSAAKSVKTK